MVAPETLTTLGVLSIPHILYCYIWFYPKSFIRACKSVTRTEAVTVFAEIAAALKLIQFTAVYLWYTSFGPLTITGRSLAVWVAALFLCTFGQALNAGIYRAIGKNGVYYGFKLGKKIPWVSGFPFNVVSHPQYVGSVMTVWGTLLFLADGKHPDVVALGVGWTLLYVLTGIQEDKTSGGKGPAPK